MNFFSFLKNKYKDFYRSSYIKNDILKDMKILKEDCVYYFLKSIEDRFFKEFFLQSSRSLIDLEINEFPNFSPNVNVWHNAISWSIPTKKLNVTMYCEFNYFDGKFLIYANTQKLYKKLVLSSFFKIKSFSDEQSFLNSRYCKPKLLIDSDPKYHVANRRFINSSFADKTNKENFEKVPIVLISLYLQYFNEYVFSYVEFNDGVTRTQWLIYNDALFIPLLVDNKEDALKINSEIGILPNLLTLEDFK